VDLIYQTITMHYQLLTLLSSPIKIQNNLRKLTFDFYNRDDVVQIAKELIGKILVTNLDGKLTSGRIVETEAYVAITDKASHSFGGRRTQRNEHMYASASTSYVYICYGMHHLFNVVTHKKEVPDAVLIRAVEPIKGIDIMLQRTGKVTHTNTLTKGPGNVCKAFGIDKNHSGLNVTGETIYLADDGWETGSDKIVAASKRIGIDGAGEDALLPNRFYLKGNRYVSGSPWK
jgi:DNA-3-methyladenine glycosylase